jgi:uncharacterized membrane protein
MLVITAISIAGVFFDSLLGSLLQAKYRCAVCDSLTEKSEHCATPAKLVSGIRFINNDTVNALATLFAAILTVLSFI